MISSFLIGDTQPTVLYPIQVALHEQQRASNVSPKAGEADAESEQAPKQRHYLKLRALQGTLLGQLLGRQHKREARFQLHRT